MVEVEGSGVNSLTCKLWSSIHQSLCWLRFVFLSSCLQRLLFSAVNHTFFLLVLVTFALHKLCSRFLNSCRGGRQSQRLLFSTVNAFFLLSLAAFAVYNLCSRFLHHHGGSQDPDFTAHKPLLAESWVAIQADLRFKDSLTISSLLLASYTILLALALIRLSQSQWQLAEVAFLLLQLLSRIATSNLIAHEKLFQAVTQPATLRTYSITPILLTALLSASAMF